MKANIPKSKSGIPTKGRVLQVVRHPYTEVNSLSSHGVRATDTNSWRRKNNSKPLVRTRSSLAA